MGEGCLSEKCRPENPVLKQAYPHHADQTAKQIYSVTAMESLLALFATTQTIR